MRGTGVLISAAQPRHLRAGALVAATLLHAGAAVAILVFAQPPPLQPSEAIPVEIVWLPDATPPAEPEAHDPPETSGSPTPSPDTPSVVRPELEPEPIPEPAPSMEAATDTAALDESAPERQAAEPPPPPPRPRPRQSSGAPHSPAKEPGSAPASAANETAEPLPPAVATAPSLPTRAAPQADGDYVDRLLARLARFREYPRAARLRDIQGRTVLRLSILANGRLDAASIATSSGHPVLDSASLETIRRAAPFPAPESGPIELLAPIVFRLGE